MPGKAQLRSVPVIYCLIFQTVLIISASFIFFMANLKWTLKFILNLVFIINCDIFIAYTLFFMTSVPVRVDARSFSLQSFTAK